MLDHFLHGFAGLSDGTQTTKTLRADKPDAYSALGVSQTNAGEAAACIEEGENFSDMLQPFPSHHLHWFMGNSWRYDPFAEASRLPLNARRS
jgi:hypothetical protein